MVAEMPLSEPGLLQKTLEQGRPLCIRRATELALARAAAAAELPGPLRIVPLLDLQVAPHLRQTKGRQTTRGQLWTWATKSDPSGNNQIPCVAGATTVQVMFIDKTKVLIR